MSSTEVAGVKSENQEDSLILPPSKFLPVAAMCILAVAVGLLAVGLYLAPETAVALLAATGIGIPVLWLVWRRPEFGLLVLVFLTSGFFPPTAIDIRLPVGGLDARDIVLLGLIGLALFRTLLKQDFVLTWKWPSLTLLLLLVVAALSAVYSLVVQKVEPSWVLSELRPFIYYGTFFLVVLLIRGRQHLIVLLLGLLVIADLTAATLLLQQFLGVDNRLLAAMTGGAWNVWSADRADLGFGAVRIIPPGHYLTYSTTILIFCLLLSHRLSGPMRALLALQFIFLNFALLFTYSRAQWVASAVALTVTVILLPIPSKIRLLRYILGVVLVLLLAYSFVGDDLEETLQDRPFITTVTNRAATIFTPEETLNSDSLQWRVFETEQSLRSISQNPLFGVGLGNAYRNPTTLPPEGATGYRSGYRLTRFVHNSYLYLAVKSGLLGLLSMVAFLAAVLASGLRLNMKTRDSQFKFLALGILASMMGLLSWAITQSHLLQVETTTVVGLLAGVMAVMSEPRLTSAGEVGGSVRPVADLP